MRTGVIRVYEQCEDFLALGPVPTASIEMIRDDIDEAVDLTGVFCTIRNKQDPVGVLAYIPRTKEPGMSYLMLLMIAAPWRNRGYGLIATSALWEYLKNDFGTVRLRGEVQIDNEGAIRFWKGFGFHVSTDPRKQKDGTTTYAMCKEHD